MTALRVEIVEPSRTARLDREDDDLDRTHVEGERGNARWILRPSPPIRAGQPIQLRSSCEGGAGPRLLYYVGHSPLSTECCS